MDDKAAGRIEVLLEDLGDRFDGMVDGIEGIREEMKSLAKQADLVEVKDDVKVIKAVLTQTNDDVIDLDKRVSVLEAKAV